MGLVGLIDMKQYLGVPSTDTTNDVFLSQQIEVISDTIEAYCARKFSLATYTETLYSDDYHGSQRSLRLFAYPVKEVVSVIQDTEDPFTDIRLEKSKGYITRLEGFLYGDQTQIVYVAGYENIPTPILDVVYSLVAERYNKKSAGIDLNFGSDVQRVSIPGTISVDFDYSLKNNDREVGFGVILGNYVNVLDFYRSERAIIGNGKLTYTEIEEEC